jgi:hypothetical protein
MRDEHLEKLKARCCHAVIGPELEAPR